VPGIKFYIKKRTDLVDTNTKIARLRQKMAAHNIAAFVVPSGDPHQSEYMADFWQARQWLTGFTGSAGTAVVTRTTAALWTDFRYWIQAAAQIGPSEFELFKQGEPDVPEFETWLSQTLAAGDLIAMDGKVVSAANVKKYKRVFTENGMVLATGFDLVADIWTDRPSMPASKAWMLAATYAGKTRGEKLDQIRSAMVKTGANTHLMTTLADIAWTFNLRGSDVHNTPVNLAFALVTLDRAILFINPSKVDEPLVAQFKRDKIDLVAYTRVEETLGDLGQETRILLDPDAVGGAFYAAVGPGVRIIEQINPAAELKAVKNATEINHMRQTAIKDGVAMVNFLYWLENRTDTGPVSELSVAETLFAFRKQQPDFYENSFDPIMAYGEHSAMCHYKASPQSDRFLEEQGMFLTDSGGNYLTGTTDITRTLKLGLPAEQEIRDYTLVLKGHISVARACFPQGTRGYQIDTLARQFLWQAGMNFGHGTGHGVGFFLCVHEGPARISPSPIDVELKTGMLLTNEPGLYREGHYGIRLENMILVANDRKTEFGQFMRFENMTLCHFETALVDRNMLCQVEIDYLNTYHQQVYDRLHPGLDPQVAAWLEQKTAPL
jgi:Xaa-Pro aminopeptidase